LHWLMAQHARYCIDSVTTVKQESHVKQGPILFWEGKHVFDLYWSNIWAHYKH
jgi:hypothetical protein